MCEAQRPAASRADRSPEVACGECGTGTGLQGPLEFEGALRILKGDDDDELPWGAGGGVSAMPAVVVRESRLHMGRHTRVVAIWLFLAAKDVDEALWCWHAPSQQQ
jgi:hypothetical protein